MKMQTWKMVLATCLVSAMAWAGEMEDLKQEIAQLRQTIQSQEKLLTQAKAVLIQLDNDLQKEKTENLRLRELCENAGVAVEDCNIPALPPPTSLFPDFRKIAIGERGHIHTARVLDVVDSRNAIIEITLEAPGPIAPSHFVKAMELLSRTLWLSGVATANCADDYPIELNRDFVVTGTRKQGETTYFVIQPFRP